MYIFKGVLLFTVIAGSRWYVAETKSIRFDECSPEEEDLNIPHQTSCKFYYRCVYHTKVLKECPDNMIFNPDINNCDYPYNVNCPYGDTETNEAYPMYDEMLRDAQITLDEFQSAATTECSTSEGQTVYSPHETDCNAYYRCVNGQKMHLVCPGVLQFNFELEICDYTYGGCNQEKTTPPTTENTSSKTTQNSDVCSHTLYEPHLDDPMKFFKCVNGRIVEEQCPPGLVFDVRQRLCNFEYYISS